MMSSVKFPSVAFSRPPTVSPVLAATEFGGVTQQHGQWNQGQNGQREKQRVGFGLERLSGEYHRHEGQQPEQGIVTKFFE